MYKQRRNVPRVSLYIQRAARLLYGALPYARFTYVLRKKSCFVNATTYNVQIIPVIDVDPCKTENRLIKLVVMSVEKMPELSSVSTSLRIPPIWRDKIRLWFAQFEAIMSPQKKGDQAMFELVSVRAVLAVSDNIAKYSDIHDLAMMADKILEQTQPHGTVAAVTENPTSPCTCKYRRQDRYADEEIAELKAAQSKCHKIIVSRQLLPTTLES
ncbi:hypothetical protein HW555_014069 [Spodoptera exigua]|uniref:Uncharacterized protein n=1 Tax=Spodoptera exigua TaxID=7107 RepID=A0A835G3E5_SPOEX|nr:hypothetical protein HW555_014069 [Spodoptera exigua]